jgi:polysaccharide pyruvyl transferase WcaK-like protein
MKYGILTFHNIPNFGAILQAYSLCFALRSLGLDCDIIDYTSDNISKRELQPVKTGNIIKDLILKLFIWPKTKSKIKECVDFMTTRNMYSDKVYNKSSLKELNNDYDAFISGSDMIWNLDITKYDWTYFLDFVDDTKPRFSYGSSIGDVWRQKDIPKVIEMLSKYALIFVREEDTCKLINNLGIPCNFVSDPTMLLDSSEWNKLTYKPKEDNYVLVYFPTKENITAATFYARNHGKKVLVMNWALPIKGVSNISPKSPIDLISYIKYSDAVFTNSYHGLLFALYMKRPVWVGNYGNRIASLLEFLGLNNIMIKNDVALSYTINYSSVTNKISCMRLRSFDCLKQIISDAR